MFACDYFQIAAQFDVDYLEHISGDGQGPSELSRQSLYVKFDPLVGADTSDKFEQTLPRMDNSVVE